MFPICNKVNIVLADFDLPQHHLISALSYTNTPAKVLARSKYPQI